MVQQRVAMSDYDLACPICLCDFVCARISKCGHSFCLSCILRHVQTSATNNPYQPVRCPCCGVPIIVEDMRPVVMEAVQPVTLQQNLRLRKLHRQKGSSAPFLPIPGAPQHGNPHFAPTTGIDADAKYSRFNYLDPEAYHSSLVANQGELQREMKSCIGSGFGDSSVERMYLSLAMEIVMEEQQKAKQEFEEEKDLMARFACSNSGMYQAQSPALLFERKNDNCDTDDARNTVGSKDNVLDDPNLENQQPSVHRYRGDSVGSYKSVDSTATPSSTHHDGEGDTNVAKGTSPSSGKRNSRTKPRKKLHGSMYLDSSNSVHLYQAEDGQLVFLNGFNMTCLLSDFSKGPPSDENSSDFIAKSNDETLAQGNIMQNRAGPLPDFLEGRVLEKTNVHLTTEIRKRMPFLNHIPLYTDIVFVELDLNHILSEGTKRKFKNEIAKRRKKRQSKVQAEKRADLQAKKEDQDRVNARKARLQTIDPDDEFFRAAVTTPAEPVVEGADFGPFPGGESFSSSNGNTEEILAVGEDIDESTPSFSFSQAAQRANTVEAFPALSSSEAFPTLGSQPTSIPSRRGGSSTWKSKSSSAKVGSSTTVSTGSNASGKTKKKKGEKLVLFSTGGARGYT